MLIVKVFVALDDGNADPQMYWASVLCVSTWERYDEPRAVRYHG